MIGHSVFYYFYLHIHLTLEKTRTRYLIGLFLAAGILLRVIQWFYNRSLWMDEAMLALNIGSLDFAGLMRPLQFDQIAPVLFLWIERSMVILFGNNEFALRLFPLACGILSLWLAYRVAFIATESRSVATAVLFLFAFSRCFIFYSTETKQYSSDLLVALVFYLFLFAQTPRRNTGLLLTSLIAVWLSNIGIVMIVTTGFAFLLEQLRKRKINYQQWMVIAAGATWFIIYFLLFIRGHDVGETMEEYWEQHFMPTDPTNVKMWVWLVQHIVSNYSTFLGTNLHLDDYYRAVAGTATAGLAVFGIIRWYNSENRRDWMLLLIAPVAIHLALSALQLYPFNGRLILYLAPSFIIISVYGWVGIYKNLRHLLVIRWLHVSWALAFIFFISIWWPIRMEETKDCIRYVNRNRCQPFIAYAGAIPAAAYYSQSSYTIDSGKLEEGLKMDSAFDALGIARFLEQSDSVWVLGAHKDVQVQEVMKTSARSEKIVETEGAALILLTR